MWQLREHFSDLTAVHHADYLLPPAERLVSHSSPLTVATPDYLDEDHASFKLQFDIH